MDLILYIGFPKTGTTTIQQNLLKNQPHYLGKGNDSGERQVDTNLFVSKLLNLFRYFLESGNNETTKNLFLELKKEILKDYDNKNISKLVISSEHFLVSPPTSIKDFYLKSISKDQFYFISENLRDYRVFPVVNFLREIVVPNWDVGQVKIIVTVRNYPDWLASRYSHMSYGIPNASAANFRQQIQKLCYQQGGDLGIYPTYQQLSKIVRKDNLLVVPFEKLFTTESIEVVARFFGVACPEKISGFKVRNRSQDLWRIRPLAPQKVFKRQKLPLKCQKHRSWIEALGKQGNQFIKFVNRKRPQSFHLDEDLRKTIKAATFKDTNKLCDEINEDLFQYGY